MIRDICKLVEVVEKNGDGYFPSSIVLWIIHDRERIGFIILM